MSVNDPAGTGGTTPPNTGPAHQPPAPGERPAERTPPPADDKPAKADDPLRGSFASHTWIAIIALIVVLVLLAVFVLQNTDPVAVNYFGFTGQSPLAVALLLAFAAGLLVAGIAGTLRIWQLRRRVKKLGK